MGILDNGIFGPMRNKTGLLVGFMRNGKNIVRAVPHIRAERSIRQIVQQQRFGLLPAFFSPVSELIAMTFRTHAKGITAMNAAVAYNYKNALRMEDGATVIDYPRIVYGRGNLDAGYMGNVVVDGNFAVFSWERSSFVDDNGIFLIYCPDEKLFVVYQDIVLEGNTYRAQLPVSCKGSVLHCYFSFISADRKRVSDSNYAGEIVF